MLNERALRVLLLFGAIILFLPEWLKVPMFVLLAGIFVYLAIDGQEGIAMGRCMFALLWKDNAKVVEIVMPGLEKNWTLTNWVI